MFKPDVILASGWYRQRLVAQQQRDVGLWRRFVEALQRAIEQRHHADVVAALQLRERLALARERLNHTSASDFVDSLHGELGVDPLGAC
jgi:hypothetical protein